MEFQLWKRKYDPDELIAENEYLQFENDCLKDEVKDLEALIAQLRAEFHETGDKK